MRESQHTLVSAVPLRDEPPQPLDVAHVFVVYPFEIHGNLFLDARFQCAFVHRLTLLGVGFSHEFLLLPLVHKCMAGVA